MTLRAIPLVLWLFACGWAAAETDRQRTIELTRPDAGTQVMARDVAGRMTVEGHDQPTIEIELVGADAPALADALSINVRGNRVEIRGEPGGGGGKPLDLRMRVPRRSSLRLRATASETVTVVGVSGQLEISNRFGDIDVRGGVGSVIAETQEGNIEIELLAVNQELPTALSAFHGDVELLLPVDLDASFSLRSKRGMIYSDFKVTPPDGPSDPRIVRGTVGDGGVMISVKTYTGDILVRAAPSP